MTERDLVRRAKAGDELAMSELLDMHTQQAHRLAQHFVTTADDAQDATQNAFVKAFTNLDRFDDRRPFAPWVMRIVTREAMNIQRAESTRFAFWRRLIQRPEPQESVEAVVQVRAEQRDLWRAVNRLKTIDRTLLTLSYFMGMNEAEVADALGIKRGAVKKRKYTALRRLRALVERDFPELRDMVAESPEPEGAP